MVNMDNEHDGHDLDMMIKCTYMARFGVELCTCILPINFREWLFAEKLSKNSTSGGLNWSAGKSSSEAVPNSVS